MPDGWALREAYYPEKTTGSGVSRFGGGGFERYTAEQMRAYAAQQVAAERERRSVQTPCALTWAIQRLNSTPYAMTKDECVEMLRGLRREIQALVGPN
jgi:hypothetical protein